jgi:hypothetical protein
MLFSASIQISRISVVGFRVATNQHWYGDLIVPIIVGIECVSTMDALSVLRDRLAFALHMAVVVVVPFLAVTRVLVISIFVLLTVVANDANSKIVPNRQWEVPIYALPMAVVVDVLWEAVTNQPSLQQSSA